MHGQGAAFLPCAAQFSRHTNEVG